MTKALIFLLGILVLVFISRDALVDAKHHVSIDDHGNFTDAEPDSGQSNDEKDKLLRILFEEGQGGWEKKFEKIAEENRKKGENKNDWQDALADYAHARSVDASQPPTEAINRLQDAFSKMGGKANRAMSGLNKMQQNFMKRPFPERAFMTTAVWSVSRNLGAFANAGEDPMGAVVAALNIAASISAGLSPTGMVVSMGISLFAGVLSLFGKGEKPKSVAEVMGEKIEEALNKYADQSLSDEAYASIQAMRHSKAFLDGVASTGNTISDSEANSLSSHVPVYYGLQFMSKLAVVIQRLVKKNDEKDAKKCVKYIELYCTIATLKAITLQQFAELLPNSHSNIRAGVFAQLESLTDAQKLLFEFLYKSDPANKIIPYFDPDKHPVTDGYMLKMVKVEDYNRQLAGTYCLTADTWWSNLVPSTTISQLSEKHPYVTVRGGHNCHWKVVPHGDSLYTIVNSKGCPGDRYCGAYLSFDETVVDDKVIVTEDHGKAVLWKITRDGNKDCYRIQNTRGCETSSKQCNNDLALSDIYYTKWIILREKATHIAQLRSRYKLCWWLTERARFS